MTETGERPRTLICSGMLVEEIDEVAGAFAPTGLRMQDRRDEGDWAALLLRDPKPDG